MTDYLKQEIDRLDQKIAAVKKSLADRELAPLAEEELAKLQAQKQVLLAAEQTPQINQEDSIDSTTRSGNVIIEIRPGDLTIQFTHASSQGGQNVQKVSTAVRITHKPTGIITSCQTQRFQEQNRKIALDLLRSKLYQRELQKIAAQKSAARAIIGRGMRAEKIRTYNFPQNRVTDHRIAKSWKALDKIIAGDLEPVVSTLTRQLPPASPSA